MPLPSLLLLINISAKPPLAGYPLHAVPHSRRKSVVATQIEILHFVAHYGLSPSALLTLRLPRNTGLKEAQQYYNNAARRFLKELFVAWIVMVEFDHYDRPHFHLLVATRQDLRTGFNFEAYHAMRNITEQAFTNNRELTTAEKIERGYHARNLTTNLTLKAVWKHLRKKLPPFGFSKLRPAELVPVEKNATAMAFYFTKQFLQEQLLGFIPRGARLLRVSEGFPRLIPRISDLVIDTPGRRRYLERRERICDLLGFSEAEMRVCYGPRWAWRCWQVCLKLNDRFGSQPIAWGTTLVRTLTEEVMTYGYVRPNPVDEYAYLLPGKHH